jgi:UDP-N-acetylglucosamine 2-epimerase
LSAEGVTPGVHLVGDVMAEALAEAAPRAKSQSRIFQRLALQERGYLVASVHRAENTNDPCRLRNILKALETVAEPVIFPLHPRTDKAMQALGYSPTPSIRLLEPVGYLDMLRLLQSARVILTDSGGVQKEAYWLGVPCVTMRDETEWTDTLASGRNVLAGAEVERIVRAVRTAPAPSAANGLCGDGRIAARCVELLEGGGLQSR